MTFHVDLWVSTAAAAPVIALAAIVSTGDILKQMTRAIIQNQDNTADLLRLLNAANWTNVINILIQTLILYFSLQSLAKDANQANASLIINGTIIGLILLVLSLLLSQIAARLSGIASRFSGIASRGADTQSEDEGS
jgi:hypothetical protein